MKKQTKKQCVPLDNLPTIIKTMSQNLTSINQYKTLCVHIEGKSTCPLGHTRISIPVVASDGKIYDKENLDAAMEVGVNFSHFGATVFKNIIGNRKYLPVMLASDCETISKLDPRQLIQKGRSLAVFAIEDTHNASFFIEKSIRCRKSKFYHKKIESFQFKKIKKEKGVSAKIEKTKYKGLLYSQSTQKIILSNPLKSTLKTTKMRSFVLHFNTLSQIRKKIEGDMKKISENSIEYLDEKNGFFTKLCFYLIGRKQFNSENWLKSIFESTDLKNNRLFAFDERFPIKHLPKRDHFSNH